MKSLGSAVLALSLLAAACRGPSVRPTSDHRPLAADFEGCERKTRRSSTAAVQGALTFTMLVDVDGAVPAAFVSGAAGVESVDLMHCAAEVLLETKLAAEGLDSIRAFGAVGFAGGAAQIGDGVQGTTGLDDKTLADTLAVAEWATPVDRGQAFLLVHRYGEAIERFRAALGARPDDTRALRGLAVALAESGGDLKEAAALAKRAIELKPQSEATHEALLRVCLAANDDGCVRDEDDKQRAAPDANLRQVELGQLAPLIQAARDRLATSDRVKREASDAAARSDQEEQNRKADPRGCKKLTGKERTLCLVRGCVERGSKTYVDSLQQLTGQAYQPGGWTANDEKDGAVRVTLSIRGAGALPHDASWEVKVDEGLKMKPLDIDANNISNQYDDCQKQ